MPPTARSTRTSALAISPRDAFRLLLACGDDRLGSSESIEHSAFALGRTASALGTSEGMRTLAPDDGRRGTVVDEALGGDRGADALLDDRYDLQDPLALDKCLYPIADLHLRRGFRGAAVHPHFPAAAGGRRR